LYHKAEIQMCHVDQVTPLFGGLLVHCLPDTRC
jgi:hypothetical protein